MKGIHVINAPIYISSIIQTFKLILPKKLMDRVQVHKTIETLYEIIDKDILPEEYGGREKPLQELMSKIFIIISGYRTTGITRTYLSNIYKICYVY